jgi:DNA-damage-inducible protein J
MKNVNVALRVDEDLKKQAETLFSELGLNLTTAFNIFLRQSVREQQIPFRVTKNVPNAVTLAAMDAAERGEDLYGPYDSVSDLMKALNA